MPHSLRLLLQGVAALALLPAPVSVAWAQSLAIELVAQGLTAPIHLEEPADGSGRRFIVQQDGLVRVLGADGKPCSPTRPSLRAGIRERSFAWCPGTSFGPSVLAVGTLV